MGAPILGLHRKLDSSDELLSGRGTDLIRFGCRDMWTLDIGKNGAQTQEPGTDRYAAINNDHRAESAKLVV